MKFNYGLEGNSTSKPPPMNGEGNSTSLRVRNCRKTRSAVENSENAAERANGTNFDAEREDFCGWGNFFLAGLKF